MGRDLPITYRIARVRYQHVSVNTIFEGEFFTLSEGSHLTKTLAQWVSEALQLVEASVLVKRRYG